MSYVPPQNSSNETLRPVHEELRLRSLRTFTFALPLMTFVYAVTSILYLVAPPFEPARPIVMISAVFAVLTLMLWSTVRHDQPAMDTPVTLGVIGLSLGHAFSVLAVSGEPMLSTTIAVIVIAAGGVLYRLTMFTVLAVAGIGGWLLVARDFPATEYTFWCFILLGCAAAGFLILWSRRSLTIRLHRKARQAEIVRRLASDQAIKLARARDAALASSQAKGQFLANVSHEIRTPLNGILGLLQLIDAGALPHPQSEYLREVEKSGRSLLAIVNDILDLSKIEAGGIQLESLSFNVGSVVEEVVGNHASAAAAKGIELVTDVAPDVPTDAVGDPLRLRQIVTNLVSNAIKFTNSGEVVVSVRAASSDGGWSDVEFRVTDTGVGVSPEQQQRIFQPFSQADTSTTRQYGGTGLGLTICRQLVELMGGTLQLRSKPGEGSSFFFTVRLELEEKLTDELSAVAQGLSELRVVALERNRRAREILTAHLTDWGIDAQPVSNVDAAFDVLRATPTPTVAIVDLGALGADWEDIARKFVSSATKRRCAVIAMGGPGEDWDLATKMGMRVHLAKPVRRARLVESLLDAVNKPIPTRIGSDDTHIRKLPVGSGAQRLATGLRILVAEDNDVNRMVIVAHLQTLGYEADTVCDGEAALQALDANHGYAAVIMDGQMPKLDGYQTTMALRKRETQLGQPRVPVFALTAHAMTGDRATALHAGMDEYLSKPFTQDQLSELLNRWLAPASQAPSVGPQSSSEVATTEVLDDAIVSQLVELNNDKPGFLNELIAGFVGNAVHSIAQMRRAAGVGDLRELKQLAHTLKGGSQQLGALGFGAACGALEAIDGIEQAPKRLEALQFEFDSTKKALQGLVQESTRAIQ